MRRILLHLLLVAVFFNTAIGLPLHEAEHWRGSGSSGLLAADAQAAGGGPAQAQNSEEAGPHSACAWCAAYAQAFAFAAPTVSAHRAVPTEPPPRNPGLLHAIDGPRHWLLFASRAPPVAQA